jgi:hypothetical protein
MDAPPPQPVRTTTITVPAASHVCFVNVIMIQISSRLEFVLLEYRSSKLSIFSRFKAKK